MTEGDRALRRIEKTSIVACLAMAAVGLALTRGPAAPLGVLGGGALVLISYQGVKSGIDALVDAASGGGSGTAGRGWALVKFFTRYAILAVAAYVIMARLRLPPIAVIAGASSFVVAVTIEALGGLRRRGR